MYWQTYVLTIQQIYLCIDKQQINLYIDIQQIFCIVKQHIYLCIYMQHNKYMQHVALSIHK